jgi:predicted negative regulator of RcsB-dependent stress response
MKKFLLGIIVALVMIIGFQYLLHKKEANQSVLEQSQMIQNQIKNVSKLVVSEGYFSQVYNYKNSKELFGQFLSVDKSALVVANAKVTVAYDLSQLKYELDEDHKILRLIHIPKMELDFNPDLEYYDMQSGILNPFDNNDFKAIKTQIKNTMMAKVQKSTLITNAQNRLISELSKFYVLVNSYGWTLEYNDTIIKGYDEFSHQVLGE